jgi:hypothetical protein
MAISAVSPSARGGDAALNEYEAAVQAFADGGDRREFMTRLMALGMTAEDIRWHAAVRGRRTGAFVWD